MLSAVLIIGCIAIVKLVLGIGALSLILCSAQKSSRFTHRKRSVFVVSGVFLVSPAIAPAGTLAVLPLPLGVLLAFVRSSADAAFLLRTWWFIVPSMLITGFLCWYVAHRFFSGPVLPSQRI